MKILNISGTLTMYILFVIQRKKLSQILMNKYPYARASANDSDSAHYVADCSKNVANFLTIN